MPSRSAVAMPASAARVFARVPGSIVLAVSGGLDSMALLDIAARLRGVRRRCCVATFDHASGPHTARAVRLVRSMARALGMPVVVGRADRPGTSEAEWREMRWRFLRSVAARRRATVVTAHTRDDQIETVVMRILRGASARGLAALYADGPIVRPLLGVRRRMLERYARVRALQFVEDPTNSNLRYLRNRVRRDLLPAIRATQPSFERDMLRLARKASTLRKRVERVAEQLSRHTGQAIELEVASFDGLNREGIAILWPAFVAPLGVALDRRGVQRATDFAMKSRTGNRAQCSGGIRLERLRETVVVTREASIGRLATSDQPQVVEREPRGAALGGASSEPVASRASYLVGELRGR